MKLSFAWLQELVELTVVDPEEIANRLTMAGVEVSGIVCRQDMGDSVVVASILEIAPHPNADRLSLCKVSDGKQIYEIVCGATNMQVGDRVAFAKIGSRLANGIKIKKSKIRGVVSEGMLCSETELAIGEESSGIIVLDSAAPLGQPVRDCLALNDTVFDIDVTPNRGDCLSVLGIARELVALGCGRPKYNDVEARLRRDYAKVVFAASTTGEVPVTVKEPQLCPRYMLLRFDITDMPATPMWMVQRLVQCGLRPINLVVDVTNYVLLELGQPLHAFDFEKVAGGEVVVRRGQKRGEKITALDEVEYVLGPEHLLICDKSKPLCIAGVMGGLDSAVQQTTRKVLLESAHFDPATIRHSSRQLGLSSESSYRFERRVDPQAPPLALARAVSLLAACASVEVVGRAVDYHQAGSTKPVSLNLRLGRYEKLIGHKVAAATARQILTSLGFAVVGKHKDPLKLEVPSWRGDVSREIDLIEEIARIEGYGDMAATLPTTPPDDEVETSRDRLMPQIRSYLSGQGFYELYGFSFLSAKELEMLGRKEAMQILNPLGQDFALLRPSLVPNLLKAFTHNFNHYRQYRAQRLFEVGRTFAKAATGSPIERRCLAALAWQANEPAWQGAIKPAADFFWMKGVLTGLLQQLTHHTIDFVRNDEELYPFLHPGGGAEIRLDGKPLGCLGRMHPEYLPEGCEEPVTLFEIDLERLYSLRQQVSRWRPFSRYPVVERDLAVVVDRQVSATQLAGEIRKVGGALLGNGNAVRLVDQYMGKPIPNGKKSLAFRILYQAADRTLRDSEVDRLFSRTLKQLETRFGATLRS